VRRFACVETLHRARVEPLHHILGSEGVPGGDVASGRGVHGIVVEPVLPVHARTGGGGHEGLSIEPRSLTPALGGEGCLATLPIALLTARCRRRRARTCSRRR